MRRAWLWLGLILIVAFPLETAAQHDRGDRSRGLNGAVEKLYQHRDELGMTTDQLARVQRIKDDADARKQPFWQQVMAVRREMKSRQKAQPDMPEAEKAALIERSGQEVERLLDEIRGIDHAAMRDVGSVLTPQQKEKIMEMIRKDADDGDRDSHRGRGDRRD